MRDVIIIGGGPAGATAAALLARAGKSVLVLEREHFPRFHIGESLLPYNREIFEEIGVWEKIQAAGYLVKRGAQFSAGSGTPRARLVFAKGRFTEHPTAFQVERSKFDELLLRHAAECGAEVSEGATVTSHRIDSASATVTYRTEGGCEHEAAGRFLLDASGGAAFTGTREGIRHVYEEHRKVAVFGHFSGVTMPSGDEMGDIVLVVRPGSWFWLIPLEPDKTSVGLVVDRAELRGKNRTPEALFDEVVRSTPELSRRFTGASRLGALHVISDYSFHLDRMVSPRLIRIGDAAGFLDPIFSSGVMLAMQSGRDGAHCAIEALAAGVPLTGSMSRYEKRTRAIMARFWEFIQGYYTWPFIELFLQPAEFCHVTSATNAVLAGRPDLPWRVRWRLRLFFLLVRMQKYLPVVPRVPKRLAGQAIPAEMDEAVAIASQAPH